MVDDRPAYSADVAMERRRRSATPRRPTAVRHPDLADSNGLGARGYAQLGARKRQVQLLDRGDVRRLLYLSSGSGGDSRAAILLAKRMFQPRPKPGRRRYRARRQCRFPSLKAGSRENRLRRQPTGWGLDLTFALGGGGSFTTTIRRSADTRSRRRPHTKLFAFSR
jgi:hypothetical protein